MKRTRRWMAVASLAAGLAVPGLVPVSAWAAPQYMDRSDRGGYYTQHPDLRQLIDRTQTDLRASNELEHGKDKQRERYRNAQKSLSTLDRHLTKGKYKKDDMDKAIEDIQNILDHNTLQASSRDALLRDVRDLRMARSAR